MHVSKICTSEYIYIYIYINSELFLPKKRNVAHGCRLHVVPVIKSQHIAITLLWRHNGCDGVSNHQLHDCLFNRSFRHRSKKTSKLRVNGLCAVTVEFLAQMASNAENVSIWLRHHEVVVSLFSLIYPTLCHKFNPLLPSMNLRYLLEFLYIDKISNHIFAHHNLFFIMLWKMPNAKIVGWGGGGGGGHITVTT